MFLKLNVSQQYRITEFLYAKTESLLACDLMSNVTNLHLFKLNYLTIIVIYFFLGIFSKLPIAG